MLVASCLLRHACGLLWVVCVSVPLPSPWPALGGALEDVFVELPHLPPRLDVHLAPYEGDRPPRGLQRRAAGRKGTGKQSVGLTPIGPPVAQTQRSCASHDLSHIRKLIATRGTA